MATWRGPSPSPTPLRRRRELCSRGQGVRRDLVRRASAAGQRGGEVPTFSLFRRGSRPCASPPHAELSMGKLDVPSSKSAAYEAASAYVQAERSLIPTSPDPRKMPAFELLPRVWCEKERRHKATWSGYKSVRPTEGDLLCWFRYSRPEWYYG